MKQAHHGKFDYKFDYYVLSAETPDMILRKEIRKLQ